MGWDGMGWDCERTCRACSAIQSTSNSREGVEAEGPLEVLGLAPEEEEEDEARREQAGASASVGGVGSKA